MKTTNRVIIHIDMDAFFASVEQREHPEFKNKPVIIGSDPQNGHGRGVVSTASYEARQFGVHSALAISQAYKRCPQGIYLRPNMFLYKQVSDQFIEILHQFTPEIEQISIDEAFMDVTGSLKLFGGPREIAQKIQQTIKKELNLTASLGIASNKSIAKICSDLQKPFGITFCPFGEEKSFLKNLSLTKIWGIGPKTAKILQQFGFITIGDIASNEPEILYNLLGNNGLKIWQLANGLDPRPVESEIIPCKSISEEFTFKIDTNDKNELEQALLQQCDQITRRLRKQELRCRTIGLKLRYQNFETITRNFTVNEPISDLLNFRKYVFNLFYKNYDTTQKIRLIGSSANNLISKNQQINSQLDLFATSQELTVNEALKTDLMIDQLQQKFGKKIMRASLLNPHYEIIKNNHSED